MNDITPKILEELREARGWSKTEVARRLDIKTVSTYANWEYGLRTPDKDMLSKIANLYDVSTDFLINGEDNRNQKININENEDPDFMHAMRSAQGFSDENKKKLLDYIEMIEELEKGRKPGDKQTRRNK